MTEIEDIKKLAPEERIKRLKEIEEGRRKEIEEAEALIRDSVREIGETAERKHAPIQQVTAHDISQLLTAEEKRMFKHARFASSSEQDSEDGVAGDELSLEEVAAEEAVGKDANKGGPIYGQKTESKAIYKGQVTTTGASTEESQNVYTKPGDEAAVQKIYRSETVTGERGEPQQMYGKSEEQSISGTYEKNKEEDTKKRKFEVPW